MATTLWQALVLAVDGPRVDIKVTAVHPDSGRFLASPVFALRLLYEHASDVSTDFQFIPKGPLGELDIDDVHSEDWAALHAQDHIALVQVEVPGSDALDERAARRRVASDLVKAGLRPDEKRWQEAFDAQWRHLWRDIDALPCAHYRIRATDPKWVAHLKVGDCWRSAAWA